MNLNNDSRQTIEISNKDIIELQRSRRDKLIASGELKFHDDWEMEETTGVYDIPNMSTLVNLPKTYVPQQLCSRCRDNAVVEGTRKCSPCAIEMVDNGWHL